MGKLVNAFAGIVAILFVVIIIIAFTVAFWPKPPLESEEKTIMSRKLPESCSGVLSTDSYLYPTAEECMTLLQLDYYAPCLSMSPAESEICMDKLDYALDKECKTLKKTLGIDYEVCLVDTLKRVYRESGGS